MRACIHDMDFGYYPPGFSLEGSGRVKSSIEHVVPIMFGWRSSLRKVVYKWDSNVVMCAYVLASLSQMTMPWL
jgi:hypothetical protein